MKIVIAPDSFKESLSALQVATIIEKENADTPDGSRYEFWVPIKKVD